MFSEGVDGAKTRYGFSKEPSSRCLANEITLPLKGLSPLQEIHCPGVKEQFWERTSKPRTPFVPGDASTKEGLKDWGKEVVLSRYDRIGSAGR